MSTTLRTGREVPSEVIVPTLLSLKEVLHAQPLAFYELVMLCRDSAHGLWGNTGQILERYAFIDAAGQVHDVIRDVVLAATDGDGLDMRLRAPIELPADPPPFNPDPRLMGHMEKGQHRPEDGAR